MTDKIVVIGTSTGGLAALQVLLPGLPKEFPWPLVVVQHRSKDSDSGLCDFLRRSSFLAVKESQDKEPITLGRVYLAPSDYHLLVEKDCFALSTEAPVCYARPSIDVLFESAADTYGGNVIGIILTGASTDGARGLTAVKASGGLTVVEEPATAQAPAMPEAAIAATEIDRILPLPGIAPFLISLCHVTTRAPRRGCPAGVDAGR